MNWEAFFWLIAMIFFIATEAMTVTLASIWFAVGALSAIVVALFGGSLMLQVTVFLASAILLLVFLRGVVRKHFNPSVAKTNIDGIVGSTGIVLDPVNNILSTGRIQINGMDWYARSTTGINIPTGFLVKVDKIEGVKVFVSVAEENSVGKNNSSEETIV